MAGNYPDAIGPRIPYDRDGTVGIKYDIAAGGTITDMGTATLVGINDESTGGATWSHGGGSNNTYSGFIFPVLTDFMGYFILYSGNASGWTSGSIETSTNTTNLSDGTWTQIAASHTINSTVTPTYRTAQVSLSANGIKAIRFHYTSGGGSITMRWAGTHLFGKPSATSDRLELWHPTLDQPLTTTPAHFDYGDVTRGAGPITKDFRIKNLSTTLTANSLTVGVEALTDSAAPTYVSQTQFRYNGGSYASTATLASLAPSTISQTFTAKLDPPSNAVLGQWSQRYYAQAGSWS